MSWIWIAFGVLIALTGAAMAMRAVFRDRARDRRRCPRCWYEIGEVASLCCPECGRKAASEAALRRTRRRWRRAALGVAIMLAGTSISAWPAVRGEHWSEFVPMRVLYWAASMSEDASLVTVWRTTQTPTRWDWAQDAVVLNRQILEDLETGRLDGGAELQYSRWWLTLSMRMENWYLGSSLATTVESWPSRDLHSGPICAVLENRRTSRDVCVGLMRWLRQKGEGTPREARAVLSCADRETWLEPIVAGTLLYMGRHEDKAVMLLRRELDRPEADLRADCVRSLVQMSFREFTTSVPSARILEVLEVALRDPSSDVRYQAAFAAGKIVENAWARRTQKGSTPRWIRRMLVDLDDMLGEALTTEESDVNRASLNFARSNVTRVLQNIE